MGQGFLQLQTRKTDAGTETQFGRSKVIIPRYQPQRAVDDRTVLLITVRDGAQNGEMIEFPGCVHQFCDVDGDCEGEFYLSEVNMS